MKSVLRIGLLLVVLTAFFTGTALAGGKDSGK